MLGGLCIFVDAEFNADFIIYLITRNRGKQMWYMQPVKQMYRPGCVAAPYFHSSVLISRYLKTYRQFEQHKFATGCILSQILHRGWAEHVCW
jgi:hypothetical protein